tara:strand:- start:103791 stop:105209 length:1419 start_codon:yes stop_codon:yes gene_type:complete
MKIKAGICALPLVLVLMASWVRAEPDDSWREQFAYTTGMQAYMYGYPGLKFASIRSQWINDPSSSFASKGNAYTHYRQLVDPSYQAGTSMNRDTLYSLAFTYVGEEPLVFTFPANPENRYMTIEFTEWYTDALGYMSQRTVGNKAAAYLIHNSGWEGEIPEGIDGVLESPTPWVLAVGRTYTTNTPDDLKIANRIQDGYKIYPLSEWGKKNPREATPIESVLQAFPAGDPLATMKTLSAAMKENPPPARDEALVKQFGLVGIGPLAITEIDKLDQYTQRGLQRATADAQAYLQEVSEAMGSITNQNRTVNGWKYNPNNWCRMAESGDFLGRAATQALSGGIENCVEEAVKLRVFKDSNGNSLNGDKRYILKFAKDQIPKVDAFWSITLYDNNFNLALNSANKYAIRDIDPAIKYGKDGSLTIILQRDQVTDPDVNWLPTPEGEDFNLFFRAYLPDQGFIDQSYVPPSIDIVK